MTNESDIQASSAQEKWHVRVYFEATYVDEFGEYDSALLARIGGIAWVEKKYMEMYAIRSPLDWIAMSEWAAVGYWGDYLLATVVVWRA